MYHGKHAKEPAIQTKTVCKLILSLLAMALVCCVSIGGVLAWLTGQSGAVVNTFTCGNVQILLSEDITSVDENPGDGFIPNEYIMIPGETITKNPVVTVKADSEYCWLFVTMEHTGNFGAYLSYMMVDDWEFLDYLDPANPNYGSVYYCELADEESMAKAAQGLHIIQDDRLYVQATQTDMQILQERGQDAYPALAVTAYAVQKEEIENPQTAWAVIKNQLVQVTEEEV